VSFHHNLPLKVYGVDPRVDKDKLLDKEKLLDEAITGLSYELGSNGWFVYGGGRDYSSEEACFYDEKEYPTFLTSNEEEKSHLKPNNCENIKIGELDSITNNVVYGVKAAVREVMKDEFVKNFDSTRQELLERLEGLQENTEIIQNMLEDVSKSSQNNHEFVEEKLDLLYVQTSINR
jgi:hypothetical protein